MTAKPERAERSRFAAVRWVASLALPMIALAAAGCIDPEDRRPGLRLSGEVVERPVEDWSFSDRYREIYVETRSPWLLPHSVTVVVTAMDGGLYVHARRPEEKRWVANVARDPRVRLEIGGKIYERRLERVEDAARQRAIYRDFLEKYGWEPTPPEERPPMRFFRVLPRAEG